MSESLYLKPNVVLQPLVDRWWAWSHLIPPVTLGLNHTKRHLRIMDSYVNAPHVHAAAVAERGMAGGPFIDLGGERADDIKALAEHIRDRRAGLLDLCTALQRIPELLDREAHGFSLDGLYAQLPPEVRGYVELSYDVRNQPWFRLLEPLLYASPHYDQSAQSIAIFEIAGDQRPFVLSTPSLDAPGRVHLDLPFASPAVDALARLKWHPRPFGEVRDLLGVDDEQADDLARMFTASAPPPSAPAYDGPGVRWRYFGHGCVLVEAGGRSVLTDPLVAYDHGGPVERYTYHDLPERIDAVLVSHAHQDHTMLETLLQLRHRIGTVVVPRSNGGSLQDPSLKLLLQAVGFPNVVEVQEFDTVDLGDIVVRAMPFVGEHADLDIRAKSTYLVEARGKRIYFAADTCNVEPAVYQRVREFVGPVDVVFLGMECDGAPLHWLYGPLLMMPPSPKNRQMEQSRTLSGSDSPKAIDLVRTLGASEAYVYSMGQEPWLRWLLELVYTDESLPIVESNAFVAWCRSSGIEAARLFGRHESYLR